MKIYMVSLLHRATINYVAEKCYRASNSAWRLDTKSGRVLVVARPAHRLRLQY